jgi:hypothetical protein
VSPELLIEVTRILNEPGMTWKVRRGLLRHKLGLPENVIKQLVPSPPDGMDFHPGDY